MTPKLTLNKWVHFVVSQKLEGGNYVYRVYMDNKLLDTIINKVPREYKNVNVFVADNWYNAQPGFIKNIGITNKPSGHIGKSSISIGIYIFRRG